MGAPSFSLETVASQPLVATNAANAANAANVTAHAERSPYLLSRHTDWLMIGGASALMFCFLWVTVDKNASISQISWAAFYLAMIVNHPHFMASYFLLYWDRRSELLKKKSYFWAAFVAPVLLAGYLGWSLLEPDTVLLSYAVNFMYFIVGWHYVKQIYGTSIVVSAKSGYYLSKRESWLLRLNMYPIWFMSWLNGNGAARALNHYGVSYQTFAVPEIARWINFSLVGLSAMILLAMVIRKYVRDGSKPPLAAAAAVAAIYVWYIPSFYHPHFFYVIPFFHSLQYLLFVVAMKRNEFRAISYGEGTDAPKARAVFLTKSLVFGGLLLVTGMTFFVWGPNLLDSYIVYDQKIFGPQLFMFLFITFINIHHYFIDNVIWRRDNPAIKKHLMS